MNMLLFSSLIQMLEQIVQLLGDVASRSNIINLSYQLWYFIPFFKETSFFFIYLDFSPSSNWMEYFTKLAENVYNHWTLLRNQTFETNTIFPYTRNSSVQQIEFVYLLLYLFENFISDDEIELFLWELNLYDKFFSEPVFYHYLVRPLVLEELSEQYFKSIEMDNCFKFENSALPGFSAPLKNFSIWEKEQTIGFLTAQLSFLDFGMLFLKEKVLFFFLLNMIILFFMFVALWRLCYALNLIYALLYFLLFALLSALLIIIWGATYIGFCVILIYCAAIPVLALYIIMLINVDLVHRLFFIDHGLLHQPHIKKLWWYFLICGLMFLFGILYPTLTMFISGPKSFLQEFITNLFYFVLLKRYVQTLQIIYSVDNIYDLPLQFYSSDLDKVASGAFVVSYSELLALVLLLLIAIIIIISISRQHTKGENIIHEQLAQFNNIKLHQLLKLSTVINFTEVLQFFFIEKFLQSKWMQTFLIHVHGPIINPPILVAADNLDPASYSYINLPGVSTNFTSSNLSIEELSEINFKVIEHVEDERSELVEEGIYKKYSIGFFVDKLLTNLSTKKPIWIISSIISRKDFIEKLEMYKESNEKHKSLKHQTSLNDSANVIAKQ